jgi:hypothetical protein
MPMSPRLLRPIARSGDSDVRAYIAAVEQADTQPLEQAVKDAYRDFIVGCKQDGIWDAIKASCILMGARTLSGALTPLKGGAPTNVNNNFVSGDYNRKTGLVGDGSTKSLNSNRSNTADPESNHHLAVYVTTVPTADSALAGIGDFTGARVQLLRAFTGHSTRHRNSFFTSAVTPFVTGLFGMSRSVSSSYAIRVGGTTSTANIAVSETPTSVNYHIFGRTTSAGAVESRSNPRLSFYSIGESLTLATLDSRVAALEAAIGAAIP